MYTQCSLKLVGITDEQALKEICDHISISNGVRNAKTPDQFKNETSTVTIDRVRHGLMSKSLQTVIKKSGLGYLWRSVNAEYAPEKVSVSNYLSQEEYAYLTLHGEIILTVDNLLPHKINMAREASQLIKIVEDKGLYIVSTAHQYIALARKDPSMINSYSADKYFRNLLIF